jgi:hypothetical protein
MVIPVSPVVVRKPFTEVVFKEGNINTLYGLPGAGKTNSACYMMQPCVEHGFYIYTNIHFFSYEDIGKAIKLGKLPAGPMYIRKPEQIITVTKISDLLEGLLTTRKNTTFIDEGGFFATSTMGTSTKVRQLKELCYIIRHLNSSLLLIAQARGSIVPDLRKTLVKYQLDINRITDDNRQLVVSISEGYITDEGEKDVRFKTIDMIDGVPMSKLPWDGYFLPKFTFDIDLSDAFEELGEYNSVEILKKGPDIIRKLRAEASTKGKKKKEEEEDEEEPEEKKVDQTEVKELYLTLEDSGVFKTRTELCSHIAGTYKKSMQWAYGICRGLPFDKDKFNKKTPSSAPKSG